MENIIFEKKEIIIGDERILFDYPILKHLEISGMLIVLLEVPQRTAYNNNVFGISVIGRQIKWQIDVHNIYTRSNKYCPFTNISIFEGKLRLNNWCSFCILVDPPSGDIQETIESR
jgi:hypothetical protein